MPAWSQSPVTRGPGCKDFLVASGALCRNDGSSFAPRRPNVDARRFDATAALGGAGRIHVQGRGRRRLAGCRFRRRQRLPRPPRRHDRVGLDPRRRDDRGALQARPRPRHPARGEPVADRRLRLHVAGVRHDLHHPGPLPLGPGAALLAGRGPLLPRRGARPAAMIPLRRLLIVEGRKELPYPEGTACAEVLRATAAGAGGGAWIFWGMAVGAGVKLLVALLFLLPAEVRAELAVLPKAEVALELAPALLGVGFILGYRQAAVCMAGAVVSALALAPLIGWMGENMSRPLYPETTRLISQMGPGEIWARYVRYIGAGAVA